MKLVAVMEMELNGKRIAAGSTFDIKDKVEADALVAAKLARPAKKTQ